MKIIFNNEKQMFCAKIYKTAYGVIVAICDIELVGKKLWYEGVEIVVSRNFYCEQKIDSLEAVNLMHHATSLNLIGNNIVELAVSMGLVHKDAVMYLIDENNRKVAHALVHTFQF